MKLSKLPILLLTISTLTNCASGYRDIEPKAISYISSHESDQIKLEYKYDVLHKKYKKKELKKGVKLVAVKLTNNSNKDIVFGKDVNLVYENGLHVYILDNDKVFDTLKQKPASYLWYLLLSPISIFYNSSNTDGTEDTSSFPIGLILGPGIAGGNMIAAGSANKKFKTEVLNYNLNATTIKQGETKYGLIGIKADSFESLKLKVE